MSAPTNDNDLNPYRFPTLESALEELIRLDAVHDLPEMIAATGEWDVIPDRHLMQMVLERVREHLSQVVAS